MLKDTIIESSIFRQQNGVIYYWDVNRSKWISIFRETISFNHNNSNINRSIWLRYNKIPSNITGCIVKRNSIITLVSVICKKSLNTVIELKKNENNINIYSLDLENEKSKIDDLLNIDIEYEDNIKCFLNINNGSIDYPIVNVEIASIL